MGIAVVDVLFDLIIRQVWEVDRHFLCLVAQRVLPAHVMVVLNIVKIGQMLDGLVVRHTLVVQARSQTLRTLVELLLDLRLTSRQEVVVVCRNSLREQVCKVPLSDWVDLSQTSSVGVVIRLSS